jgi:hypothetical protein
MTASQSPKYIIVRFFFMGWWEIGAPRVIPSGTLDPNVIGAYAKHGLPWFIRLLFVAKVTTSDHLPQELRTIL